MRWTLILAPLALLVLLLPSAASGALIPGSRTHEGHFTLATGQSRTFTLQVFERQTGGELVLEIRFDKAGYASGLHVTSPQCQDPDLTGISTDGALMGRVRCGYPAAGKYVFKMSLERGAIDGIVRGANARVS